MGQRASNTATITFNDTEVPAENLLGEENKGFKLAMMTLDRTRPGVAAMATGIARAAFEFATEYSKERVQFGVPIAMHQAIQFMIADMATKVHLSRLATWNSAVLLDQGKRNTLESSHAKRFAADTAMEVTTDAVQVYGGYGFIKEYPVEKLMRDAKIMQLYEGTSQIQRLVIARETLLPRRVEEPAAASSGPRSGTACWTERRARSGGPPSSRLGGGRQCRRRPSDVAGASRARGGHTWRRCPARRTEEAVAERRAARGGRARPAPPARARRPARRTRWSASCAAPGCCRCSSCTSSATGRRYGNQLMERVAELSRRPARRQPEHDVPAAAPLEADGLVAGEWEHPERRSRRFYRLTARPARPSASAWPASVGRRGWTPSPRGARAASGASWAS